MSYINHKAQNGQHFNVVFFAHNRPIIDLVCHGSLHVEPVPIISPYTYESLFIEQHTGFHKVRAEHTASPTTFFIKNVSIFQHNATTLPNNTQRAVLCKLTVTQLANKFTPFCGIFIHYCDQNSPALIPIMSQN